MSRANLLTVKDIASYLTIHEITVYRMLKAGKIPALRIGGQWRFDLTTVKERLSGTGPRAANYRAHRFSDRAAASAAWFEPGEVPDPGLLSYVLMDQPLPDPAPPASWIWFDGYAAFWEADPDETSVMGALWVPNVKFQHDHYEINAIHITGCGKTLVRNTGYEGWGNGAAGYSWDYIANYRRAAHRGIFSPGNRHYSLGFRLARSVP